MQVAVDLLITMVCQGEPTDGAFLVGVNRVLQRTVGTTGLSSTRPGDLHLASAHQISVCAPAGAHIP
jgi:hypothetical protein